MGASLANRELETYKTEKSNIPPSSLFLGCSLEIHLHFDAFDVKCVEVRLALPACKTSLVAHLERGGDSLLGTQQMSAILPTAHCLSCCSNANKTMAEKVDHVYMGKENFNSAVIKSLVESNIDDIRSYLFEPEYSAEDLRHMELEEAAAAQAVHCGSCRTCKFSSGLSKWEYKIAFTLFLKA